MFSVARTLVAAIRTINQQQRLIEELKIERQATELAYMRISRDLIEQFLITLDQPDLVDQDLIRVRLANSLAFYRDEISVLEEHVR